MAEWTGETMTQKYYRTPPTMSEDQVSVVLFPTNIQVNHFAGLCPGLDKDIIKDTLVDNAKAPIKRTDSQLLDFFLQMLAPVRPCSLLLNFSGGQSHNTCG